MTSDSTDAEFPRKSELLGTFCVYVLEMVWRASCDLKLIGSLGVRSRAETWWGHGDEGRAAGRRTLNARPEEQESNGVPVTVTGYAGLRFHALWLQNADLPRCEDALCRSNAAMDAGDWWGPLHALWVVPYTPEVAPSNQVSLGHGCDVCVVKGRARKALAASHWQYYYVLM